MEGTVGLWPRPIKKASFLAGPAGGHGGLRQRRCLPAVVCGSGTCVPCACNQVSSRTRVLSFLSPPNYFARVQAPPEPQGLWAGPSQPEIGQAPAGGSSWPQQAGAPSGVPSQQASFLPAQEPAPASARQSPSQFWGFAQVPVTLQHSSVFSKGQSPHLPSAATWVAWLGLSTYPATRTVPAARAATATAAKIGLFHRLIFISTLQNPPTLIRLGSDNRYRLQILTMHTGLDRPMFGTKWPFRSWPHGLPAPVIPAYRVTPHNYTHETRRRVLLFWTIRMPPGSMAFFGFHIPSEIV